MSIKMAHPLAQDTSYTPSEGDVFEDCLSGRYAIVDRVTVEQCYYRIVDRRGGLIKARCRPVEEFIRMARIEGTRWHQ